MFWDTIPGGKEVVVICTAVRIVIERFLLVVLLLPSITCAEKLKVPLLLGGPKICPPEFNSSPGGNEPELSDQVNELLQLAALRDAL